MAYTGDPYPPTYDPIRDPAYPSTAAPRYDTTRFDDRENELTREVTAGSYRFGLRDALLGIVGIFTVLGIVLGVLGFAAAFALDRADDPGLTDVQRAANALPAFLVSVLPFLAAPVLALGLGAWAGHASRNSGIGSIAGAIGCFVGPLVMLLVMGVGFALGAGAASLNLAAVEAPAFGISPGWGSTIPYVFTGVGLLWLLGNTLAGGLSGGLIGGILDGRWSTRHRVERRRYARRTTRY